MATARARVIDGQFCFLFSRSISRFPPFSFQITRIVELCTEVEIISSERILSTQKLNTFKVFLPEKFFGS